MKKHEPLKHPASRQQLEEVWKEHDGLGDEKFDPRVFFFLHGLCVCVHHCVCVCITVCVCESLCVCVMCVCYVCVFVCHGMCVCLSWYVCVYVTVCVCASLCVCVCVHHCVCVCITVCVCASLCVCVFHYQCVLIFHFTVADTNGDKHLDSREVEAFLLGEVRLDVLSDNERVFPILTAREWLISSRISVSSN